MSIRNTLAFVLVLPALACTQVTTFANADHCSVNEGDRYCAELFPDKPYCIQGQGDCSIGDKYGCVAEVSSECHAPCGILGEAACMGMSSTGTDSETGSESESSASSESSTTGPMPCMDNEDCPDAGAPFCEPVSGECVGCDAFGAEGDAACAGLDPMAPLCVNGACVACTPENPVVCDDQLLLCDGSTNACVPCTEHAQCGSGACELSVGRCFPADFVVTVDGDGPADYMTIVAAVAAVEDAGHGVVVVHELNMGASYQATVTINNGKTIALLAAQGENPIIQGTGTTPGLRVEGAGTILYMDGVQVSQATGRGVEVTEAFAWLDRSRVVNNNGGGIVAENAAELVLRNCFAGTAVSNLDTVVISGATASLLYTTVIAGDGGLGESRGLFCDMNPTVNVRNSIVVAVDDVPEIDCATADVSYSATEMATPGTGNAALGNLQTGWFMNEIDDFRLDSPPAVIGTTARWTTGDPLTDIDGDARPTVDGTADFAGADVP